MTYAKVYFEDLDRGTEMPPLAKAPIDLVQLARYAAASGDFNPAHRDDQFARAAGLGGVLAHGMLVMGFVAQSLTDWLGVGAVATFSLRFTRPVRVGDVIVCRGRVVEKRPATDAARGHEVDISLRAVNAGDEEVAIGRATVRLRARS